MTDIPDGYGVIAGRSRKNAQAALDAAEQAGVDPTLVVAVDEGYLVPDAVLEAFHAVAGGTDSEAAAVPVSAAGDEPPTSDWKNADIKDWADAHDVDLGGATTKADMLAAIDAAGNKEE